jgi:hypothetical protein
MKRPKQTTKYLSEVFTRDDFASMTNDRMYAFYSVPDSGKTTMITNVLQPYLKESNRTALYLSPRKAINDQNKADFDDTVISSATYQKLEADITTSKAGFYSGYDFIICDEAHYFVEDSTMNNFTEESFNFVNNSDAIILLMSGTPDCLAGINELWRRPIVTLADIDKGNHNITKVCLSPATDDNQELLMAELDRLATMKKRIIVYHSNIKKLLDLSTKYKQRASELGIKVSFICSLRNKDYAEHCDTKELDRLTKTRSIDADLLFVTSALNTGVSIDEDFEYLFIFGNPSKTDIFQLIARVRKGENDRRIKVVFCSVPKVSSLRLRLERMQFDLTYQKDPVEWQTKKRSKGLPDFVQIPHSYVYDAKGRHVLNPDRNRATTAHPTVNRMRLGKMRQDISEYSSLLHYGPLMEAYKWMFIERYADIIVTTLRDELELRCVHQINAILERYADQEYLEDDQKEAIKALCRGAGLQTSIGKINDLLNKHSRRFLLISKQRKVGGRNTRAWSIIRR